MPTNTAGGTARLYHQDMVHYIAKTITFADDGKTVVVGTIPSGAIILPGLCGVAVNVVFNGGSTNTVDVGISGTLEKYSSDLALGTLGWIEQDVVTEAAGVRLDTTADETILATVVSTAGATTGSAVVVMAYLLPDR
jgi:hypothetical protein